MIQHLACIMDGNRRWAKKQGKVSWLGHKEGMKAAQKTIQFCLDSKISYLSLYAFSLENFRRSEIEKNYIFDLLVSFSQKYLQDLIQKNVKVRFVGDRKMFPSAVVDVCQNIEMQTEGCTALECNILFCYGSQQEIVSAMQRAIHEHVKISSVKDVASLLWTAGTPDPDLIIRTGGVHRLSNFLLFQAAYAEIRFSETLWPDMAEDELSLHVQSAISAQKNYGK